MKTFFDYWNEASDSILLEGKLKKLPGGEYHSGMSKRTRNLSVGDSVYFLRDNKKRTVAKIDRQKGFAYFNTNISLMGQMRPEDKKYAQVPFEDIDMDEEGYFGVDRGAYNYKEVKHEDIFPPKKKKIKTDEKEED